MKKIILLLSALFALNASAYDPHGIGKHLDVTDPFQTLQYYRQVDRSFYSEDDKQFIYIAKKVIENKINNSEKSFGNGYSHCSQLLVGGVYDSYLNDSRENQYLALKDYFCSLKTGSSNSDFKLSGAFDGFGAKFGYKSGKEWQQNECKGFDGTKHNQNSDYRFIQVANRDVVNSWSQCVKQKTGGFNCWAEENSGIVQVILDLDHGREPLDVEEIVFPNLESFGNTQISKIKPGQKTLQFQRIDAEKPANFFVNAFYKDTQLTCNFIMPAPVKVIPLPDKKPEKPITENQKPTWCAKLYNHHYYGGEEMYVLPGEAVSSLGSRGMHDKVSSIRVNPKCELEGWHHDNFQWDAMVLKEDHPDLRYLNGGLSDALSSVRCTCK